MARGLQAAQEFHAQNTGLAYNPFKLEKSGESAIVRVLQPDSDWVNFFVHQVWDNQSRKFSLQPTRCPSDGLARDADVCPLCALGDAVPRSLKTFIPVRVRDMDPADRVDIIAYGRNGLDAVVNIITELPEGHDITMYDVKVKRQGVQLDTQYYWMLSPGAKARPLSAEEKALEIPDMETLWEPPTEIELDRRARQFAQSIGVKPVSDYSEAHGTGGDLDDEIPF